MIKQNKILIIIAVAIIVIGFILMAKEGKAPQNNGESVAPVNEADHVWGSPNAPVQMIVYSDFECPFCVKFFQTMKQIEENFKNQIAITFRHYPLFGHPDAKSAAEASECASEQGKFWEMHDKLFADNEAKRMSVDQFKQDAVDLGLEQEQFNQCLDSGQYQSKIIEQKNQGDKTGVTGTPTIFVNGNIYPGAYPFEDFTSPDGQSNKGMKSIISGFLNK
jgi:protein-disulfide isomerase